MKIILLRELKLIQYSVLRTKDKYYMAQM